MTTPSLFRQFGRVAASATPVVRTALCHNTQCAKASSSNKMSDAGLGGGDSILQHESTPASTSADAVAVTEDGHAADEATYFTEKGCDDKKFQKWGTKLGDYIGDTVFRFRQFNDCEEDLGFGGDLQEHCCEVLLIPPRLALTFWVNKGSKVSRETFRRKRQSANTQMKKELQREWSG
jgi:hypothetical protein